MERIKLDFSYSENTIFVKGNVRKQFLGHIIDKLKEKRNFLERYFLFFLVL